MRTLPLVLFGLASLCHAQVAVSAVVRTDLLATASGPGGTPVTNVVRAGLPVQNLVATSGVPNGGTSIFSVTTRSDAASATYVATEIALQAQGFASLGPHEHVPVFQGTPGLRVRVEIDWNLTAPAGAAVPLVAADVGDDGTFDFVLGTPNATILSRSVVLGPTGALPIRLRTGTLGSADGFVNHRVTVRVTPGDLVAVQPVLATCGGGELVATPLFGRRIELSHRPAVLDPQVLHVLVAGFSRAPVVLPSGCVGLPAVDVALVIADPVRAPLPPGSYGVTAQVVALDFGRGEVSTSNALGITVR